MPICLMQCEHARMIAFRFFNWVTIYMAEFQLPAYVTIIDRNRLLPQSLSSK